MKELTILFETEQTRELFLDWLVDNEWNFLEETCLDVTFDFSDAGEFQPDPEVIVHENI
jgi:hypothetical protein